LAKSRLTTIYLYATGRDDWYQDRLARRNAQGEDRWTDFQNSCVESRSTFAKHAVEGAATDKRISIYG
jgi:hypothetical protein